MKERPWNNYTQRMYDDIFKVERKVNPFKQSIVAVVVVIICIVAILILKVIR